jgi:phage gp36-like protein
MQFCTRDHITDLLYAAYLAKCEELNPGLVERTITAVSGEVAGLLMARYPQPWPYVPAIISYIASVISAYRIVEAITSLVSSEAGTDNEWLPLQKQWKYVTGLLDDLVKQRTRLEFDGLDEREEAGVAVVSKGKHFDWRGF